MIKKKIFVKKVLAMLPYSQVREKNLRIASFALLEMTYAFFAKIINSDEYQPYSLSHIFWQKNDKGNLIGKVSFDISSNPLDCFEIVSDDNGVRLYSLLPEQFFPRLYDGFTNNLPCENIMAAKESAVQFLLLEYLRDGCKELHTMSSI